MRDTDGLKAPPSNDVLLSKLADLGATPEAVAEALEARGVVGTMCDGEHCALANYLRAEFAADFVQVASNFIKVRNGGFASVPTPAHLRQFINDFDMEEFPDLLDPNKPGTSSLDDDGDDDWDDLDDDEDEDDDDDWDSELDGDLDDEDDL